MAEFDCYGVGSNVDQIMNLVDSHGMVAYA
jgi:hypothetical protein